MEKFLILFLSLLFVSFCNAQLAATCDCNSKQVKDSLIAEYLDKGDALPNMYNNPRWLTLSDSLIAICPNIVEAYQHKAVPYLKNSE